MPVALSPDQYKTLSPVQLLDELAFGRVGFDHAFLDALLQDPDAAATALAVFVSGDHEDDRVDIEDQVFDLFRHLRTPLSLPFYLLQLRSQMDGVRDELIEAFAELGEPAVEPLLSLYHEVEEEEGGEVAFVLAALQLPQPRITELLLGRLEYDAQDAAICLGIHGDIAAKPALEQLLDEVKDRPEAQLLKTDVEEALGRLGEPRDPAGRPVYNIYEHYDAFQPPFFEAMEPDESLAWLASSDPQVRLALAESIDDDVLEESVINTLIAHAGQEDDLAVRCAVWKSLLPAEPTKSLLATLWGRLRDESIEAAERATLAVVLAKMDYNLELKSKILDVYGDESLRPLAIEAMWYTSELEFLPLVQGHLDDEDLATRRAAILGIGFFVDTSSAPQLVPAMAIEDLRVDAIYSYALAHPGEVSRITAQKVLKHVEQVAGGLLPEEAEMAMSAIDLRLGIQGIRPFFAAAE